MDPNNDFIESVCQGCLDDAKKEREIDSSSEKIIEEEKEYIKNWRKARHDETKSDTPHNDLVGLALSGGGIRSATFSLGIMQAFTAHDVLKKVDYLSTVSGGGYIGSSVNWLTSRLAKGDSPDKEKDFSTIKGSFPYGSDDPRPGNPKNANPTQNRMLQYLREHGYYLTPGAGITAFSLLAAVLRGTFLNLMVWIPTFILIFLLLLAIPNSWIDKEQEQLEIVPATVPGSESLTIFERFSKLIEPEIKCPTLSTVEISALGDRNICQGAALSNSENVENHPYQTTPLTTAEVRQKIAAQKPYKKFRTQLENYRIFEGILFLGLLIAGLLAVAACIYSFVTKLSRNYDAVSSSQMYRVRRWNEKRVAFAIPVSIVCLLIGSMPLVSTYLQSWIAVSGPAAVLLGIIIAFRDFLQSASSKESSQSSTLVGLGMGLFLYGVAISSFLLAQWLFFEILPDTPSILVGLIVVIIGLGWFVNINYISVHRYYRDRLMESFMPDIDDALKQRTGRAEGANNAKLHEINKESAPHGPYHIVNTNVVLVNSEQPLFKNRGGDSFILSPLYCGSNATGWRSTKNFMQGRMTLATAVAISGAAANPNTGVGGVGLTRNMFVSLAMSLLNLRLGYWAENPNLEHASTQAPNHFKPGAYALGNAMGFGSKGGGYNEKRDFVQLSDGGHFENMGLYELIRRRVKLAIVCDGGADKDFSFSDMQTTVRRIEDDFGAQIKIIDDASPDQILPVKPDDPTYPPGADSAEHGYMLARIIYSNEDVGWLIFMKTTFIEDVSFKVKGYKAQNPSFPDESTADQFFDEVQFEAYRELGYCIADNMLTADLPQEIGEGKLKDLVQNCSAFPGSSAQPETP